MGDVAHPRAVRKQLLLLRSATDRAEMHHALVAVRQSATVFGKAAPGLAMGRGLPLALGLLKRAPLLSPLLSLARAGARRPVIRYVALAAGAGFVAWKGWQWLAVQRAPGHTPVDGDSILQPDPGAPE